MENQELIKLAINARECANAEYSKFKVGAAGVTSAGEIFTGANMESSTYGLTLCAERLAIFQAAQAGKKLAKLAVVADTKNPVSPCGACRQIMVDYMDADAEIIMANLTGEFKIATVQELLPYAFTEQELKSE